MNEQIQEIRYLVGEAWKGEYNSATTYGNANVVQDPTGLSVYRSLKPGNVGHPLTDTAWWFCIINLSSIKAESDRIAALNTAIAQDEQLRVAAEQSRVQAEQARVDAEAGRVSAEAQRVQTESNRVSAESARVLAEQGRVAAENQRAVNEENRQAVFAEDHRVAVADHEQAEQDHTRAESDHTRAESDHAAVEVYVDSLGAFDISAYHATGGVLAKYADLTAALGTNGANIPEALRKGGMSVKFVLSSDNKYVQCRLTADDWSINTEDWAIVNEGVYVDNPEFVYIQTDRDGKILWAIKKDGSIYYGAGVPQQVKDYIEDKISSLSLDEYEDIVAFLSDYLGSDTTLRTLLDSKLGAEGLDSDALNSVQTVNNQEYLDIVTDLDGRILEGIDKKGNKIIAGELSNPTVDRKADKVAGKSLIDEDVANAYAFINNNPEWIDVVTDKEGRILAGIKSDGSIEWALGVPTPIKEYVEENAVILKEQNLSSDEKIIVRKNLGIDNTLKAHDKALAGDLGSVDIIGDSISAYQGTLYYPTMWNYPMNDVTKLEQMWWSLVLNTAESPLVTNISYGGSSATRNTDSGAPSLYERSLLISAADTVFIELGTNDYLRNVPLGSYDYVSAIENLSEDEFIPAYIKGIKSIKSRFPNAKIVLFTFAMSDDYADAIKNIALAFNLSVVDVRGYSAPDNIHPDKAGMLYVFKKIAANNLIGGLYNVDAEQICLPEDMMEATLDADKRILGYRKSDGTRVEEKMEIHSISLSKTATTELSEYLKAQNYIGTNDWSDAEYVELPVPAVCAVINIGVDSQANAKNLDIKTTIEYWDKYGNYFKKPILLNAQGQSSMSYNYKNQAIDIDDDSKIKFGNWIACDSFHIKKFFIDVFRGQCNVGYKLTEQVYQTKPYGERRPWDYTIATSSAVNGKGSFKKDFDTGALAHPDGFPVKVFFNGKNAGIYAFNLKKDRANYYCSKDNQNNVLLDGEMGEDFFTADGNMTVNDHNLWTDFEVRNPKIKKDINGNTYDGDNPTEPADTYMTCKDNIKRLTGAISAVNAETTDADKKAKYEEYFNVPFVIDYYLISQLLYHWDGFYKNWIWLTNDGNIWSPTLYDLDSIFGLYSENGEFKCGYNDGVLGTSTNLPTGILAVLYSTEIEARYKELRDKDIFSVNNVITLLENWLKACGYDNLKEDAEEVVVSPYYDENDQIVMDESGKPVMIPFTPSYRDNEKRYAYSPQTGGFYNSINRVKNWLTQRIARLDTYFNYNQN